jgi:hypothetical protein
MEMNEFFVLIFLTIIYFFKDTNKFCAGVWLVLKSFFIALFALLILGFVKEQLKKK